MSATWRRCTSLSSTAPSLSGTRTSSPSPPLASTRRARRRLFARCVLPAKKPLDLSCVADPGCFSRFWFLSISDPESRIQNQQQKRGVKKNFVISFFVAINITKLKIVLFLIFVATKKDITIIRIRNTGSLIVIVGVFLMPLIAECSAAQRCGVSFPESHAGRALQIGPRHSGRRSSRLWAAGRSDSDSDSDRRYNYRKICTFFAVSFLLCTWRIFCKWET